MDEIFTFSIHVHANNAIAKNANGSNAEKNSPMINQILFTRYNNGDLFPINLKEVKPTITYNHFSITSRSTPVNLINKYDKIPPMIGSHTFNP